MAKSLFIEYTRFKKGSKTLVPILFRPILISVLFKVVNNGHAMLSYVAKTGTNAWRNLISVIENAPFLCVYMEALDQRGSGQNANIWEMQIDSMSRHAKMAYLHHPLCCQFLSP